MLLCINHQTSDEYPSQWAGEAQMITDAIRREQRENLPRYGNGAVFACNL